MGDVKHDTRSKKRLSSSGGSSSSPNCTGVTASYDLESETARLNDFVTRLKESNYWVPAPSDSLQVLHRLLDCAFFLLRSVVEAIDKERMRLSTADLKKIVKAQRDNQAAILGEMKIQHDTKVREVTDEKIRVTQEQASIIEGLTAQQDGTLQALEKEKEKSICQICFVRPRDAVVLTCMHHLYCNDCLEAHKLRSNRCPTCRGVMSGICKLNH